jgi:hypothetical protein
MPEKKVFVGILWPRLMASQVFLFKMSEIRLDFSFPVEHFFLVMCGTYQMNKKMLGGMGGVAKLVALLLISASSLGSNPDIT